jgi:hypothetical protein
MGKKIQGKYKELNMVENLTANGDYPSDSYLTLQGDRAIAIYGDFDGATLSFVFYTEKSDGNLSELPVSTDFTFTSIPDLQRFSFPVDAPFKIRIASAGASTDLSVNVHQVLQ